MARKDEPRVLPVLDDPPRAGYFAPELSELELTPEEIASGNRLGAVIDVDDDADNGLGGVS